MSGLHDPTARRMVEAQDPDAAVATALQRLQASRSHLRQIMVPPRRSRAPRGDDAGPAAGDLMGWLPRSLRDGVAQVTRLLRKHPISSLAVDALSDWWERHPVRAAASAAGSEVAQAAGPLIRRYPVAAVGLAALLGAALIGSRPWRWRMFGGSPHRPLYRRLAGWMAAQVPLQAMLGTLIALLADQARQAASRPTAPPPPDVNPAAAPPVPTPPPQTTQPP